MAETLEARIKKAVAAKVIDYFHLPLSEYARLTSKQIYELYFHARDNKGRIKVRGLEYGADAARAKKPATLEQTLEDLDYLKKWGGGNFFTDAAKKVAEEQARQKFASLERANSPGQEFKQEDINDLPEALPAD